MKTFKILLTGVFVLALPGLSAGPAAAHGDISSSSPEADARVRRAPREVRLVLAEPPAAGSSLTVVDGCGDKVSGDPKRNGQNFSAAINGGRPGRWRVQLRSISAVDGHVISDRFTFQVAGKRDCSSEPKEPKNDKGDDVDTSSRPPIENEDDGSSFPIVPFALGTVAVVGVAVALRAGSNKKS